MSIAVRNEQTDPFVFNEGGRRKVIQPGAVYVLSDAEWDSVIPSKRGPGAINPLGTEENTKTNLDWDNTPNLIYYGTASQQAADTDPLWTVKKFNYGSFGGQAKITQIQVLTNVKWSDRATLGWT